MRTMTSVAALLVGLATFCVHAELEPWKDYEPSEAVWSVVTVKVHSNMGDAYLEGLRDTWVPGNEAAKKLGQIEDYWIYRSELPESGDFNLLLVIKMKNTEALAPSKARYDAYVQAVTKKKMGQMTTKAQTDYPGMRVLTGEYLVREIKFK